MSPLVLLLLHAQAGPQAGSRIRASLLYLPISLAVQELLLVPGRMGSYVSQNRQLLFPALHATHAQES